MFGLQWFRLKWFNSESSINCYYFYTCAYLILFVLSGLPLLFLTLCFQLPCPHPALSAWKCCELKRNKCMWQNVRVLKCHSGDSRHWFLPGKARTQTCPTRWLLGALSKRLSTNSPWGTSHTVSCLGWELRSKHLVTFWDYACCTSRGASPGTCRHCHRACARASCPWRRLPACCVRFREALLDSGC